MIVLEEWDDILWPTRLVVRENGAIEVMWRALYNGEWKRDPRGQSVSGFPLFAPTKTPQRPASTSPRRKRSPRG